MQLGGGKAVYGDLTSTSQLPSAQNIFMMEQKKKVLPLRLMCSGPHKVFRFRIRFFSLLFIHSSYSYYYSCMETGQFIY